MEVRAKALEETARRLRGPLSRSRSDLRRGLDLFEEFAKATAKAAASEWNRAAPSADAQASVLTPLLQRLTVAATLLEKHFAHGERRELSESLSREIRATLAELGLQKYVVITAHGDANNFITSHGDLEAALFGPLIPILGPQPFLSGNPHTLFQIPRLEGWGLCWRPWLLGHEVAHLAVAEYDGIAAFGLKAKFDYAAAANTPSPLAGPAASPIQKRKGLYEIARNWLTELLCDAFAMYRYGPAAVAAIGEFSATVGANQLLSSTHPPGVLRLKMLELYLQHVANVRLEKITKPWLAGVPAVVTLAEPWADELKDLFVGVHADLLNVVAAWPAAEYHWRDRSALILHLADRLMAGLPGDELIRVGDSVQAATDADVVNAIWVARVEGCKLPVDELGRKALDSLEFCRRWVGNGGGPPELLGDNPHDPAVVGTERGTLSEAALLNRMHPQSQDRLFVTPLLQLPRGSALDLRLGNRFIVFRRTSVGSFDPLEEGSDPRLMQVYIELDWSEQFILHPNEMVLGSSLEYLALPRDLAAQVASRSSYGRLGLLSATAVQVHPYFHGCLTLELVNLSTIPLALSPGERIAQLIIGATDVVADPGVEKYVYATGPEFSKVRDDDEAAVLRGFRK